MRACTLVFVSLLVGVSLFAGEGYQPKVQVKQILRTGVDAAGRPIEFPKGNPELVCVEVTVPPGEATGWHTHPHPCVGYLLEGELTLEVVGLPKKLFKAGEAIAEVIDRPHRGINTGETPAKVILFVASEEGSPISKPAPAPE